MDDIRKKDNDQLIKNIFCPNTILYLEASEWTVVKSLTVFF